MSAPLLIVPNEHDLGGGFVVRRALPSAERRSVGPFVFFDHMGPVAEKPGNPHDVRPHPHIGLATVTYLFEGAMMHRDSLGHVQRIEPGAINWMTAGRGIVHSERKPEDLLDGSFNLHGLQLWAALPREHEECEPAFFHTAADALPVVELDGARVRVLIGSAWGHVSPVQTFSSTLYLDITLSAGHTLTLPDNVEERALYCVEGEVELDGHVLPPRTLACLDAHAAGVLTARRDSRLALVGGAKLDGPRAMWWNFVSSRRERIEMAKEDWRAQRMGQIDGETEWIPLPER
jgi:redox-sensitive bicupin YhaK (pirin superfamily)